MLIKHGRIRYFMERPGLCFECGKVANPAYSCRICGAIVCSEHFSKEKGVCLSCLSKLGH